MASMKKIGKSYRITVELGKDSKGKRQRKYITIKDKKIASNILAHYNAEEKFGGFVTPNKKKFKDTMEHWLYNHALFNVEILTFVSYYEPMYNYIIPKLGEIYTQQLTVSDLEQYYAYLMNDCGLSANTVKHHHANIHKALKIAKKNKEIISNVADDVELPKVEEYENQVYNSEQLHALFELVADTDLYIPVMIGAYTGLRRSEVVGLQWDDIDFEERVIHVKHAKITVRKKFRKFLKPKHGELTPDGHLLKKPKNKTSYRDVPMCDALYEILWKWRIAQKDLRAKIEQNTLKINLGNKTLKLGKKTVYNEFVCTMLEDGREMKPDFITQCFHRVILNSDLPMIRFHDLRGTLATLLIENDENIKYVSELLGHYDTRTTERYYAKTVKARMQKVGSTIDAVI